MLTQWKGTPPPPQSSSVHVLSRGYVNCLSWVSWCRANPSGYNHDNSRAIRLWPPSKLMAIPGYGHFIRLRPLHQVMSTSPGYGFPSGYGLPISLRPPRQVMASPTGYGLPVRLRPPRQVTASPSGYGLPVRLRPPLQIMATLSG